MKKRIICFLLTVCIFCTLVTGIVPIANASNAYVINGVTVHYDDFASSPNECWAYANNVYYKIWGQNFSSLFASSDNYLRNLPDTELTLTAAHLKAYVTNAALGSCLRICNSEYLHGNDGWGHSQIIVQKDASGFTVFEGGLTAAPHCREKYYTWSEYINTGWLGGTYSYIKYIKWPGCSPYSGNDTTTPGKPVLKDFSRSYSHGATVTFKWDNTINTTHYNLYIDKQNSDSTWQVDYQYWHYATSGVSTILSDGIYRVLLQSTNSNADGWPYTNGDYVTFVVGPHTHDKSVYMFFEAVHPHCNCYECSICGEIWRDTTSSNELDNCYYCQRPGKPALSSFATSYVSGSTIVFRWNPVPKTTHYNLYIDKQNSDGSWEVDFKYWHYATSGLTTTLDTGTYRVLLQATNSNFPGEDGTGWAYTNADYITFVVTPATVTVTFDPNGGTCFTGSKTITAGGAIGDLPTPTRDEYDFAGWYYADSYGNTNPINASTAFSEDITLYAQWATRVYTGMLMDFLCEGGELGTQKASLAYTGFNCGRNTGDLVIYNCAGQPVKTDVYGGEVAVDSTGRVIQKRYWGDENYLIVPDGGFVLSASGTSSTPTMILMDQIVLGDYVGYSTVHKKVYIYATQNDYLKDWKCLHTGEPYGLLPVPTREGYDFLGWFTERAGGEQITEGSIYNGVKLVYAHWRLKQCDHDWVLSENTQATCTEPGRKSYTCTICGDTRTETVDALGHDLTNHDGKAPTCTEFGWDAYVTCSRCDYTSYVEKTALGHDYQATVMTPTCTERGYTTYTCSRCGDSYQDAYVSALGHAYQNGVCIKCGALDPNLENPFSDVKKSKYFYMPVLWAYYHNPRITGGTGDGKFSPNATCTREQIVTFLWKAYGAPEPQSYDNPFKDVKKSKYYYKAVLWAAEKGITSGVGNGKFGVGQGCTREQAMTFLWVAAGKPGHSQQESAFTDVKKGKYYYNAILWAVENGITSGVGNGKFGVGQTCTRAQIVTFLYALLGK